MNQLPIIRNVDAVFATPCCDRPDGQKLLHKAPRVPLTRPISNAEAGDVLQDEAGFPILDEITNHFIYDDWRND